MSDLSTLIADREAAMQHLNAQKALCEATCGEANAAVMAIEPEARMRAAGVAHVQKHHAAGTDPVGEALAVVPQGQTNVNLHRGYLAAVAAAAQALREGTDPHEAAGADPVHVAAVTASWDAHEGHREVLGAAYAEFARLGNLIALES